jgi:hypothetical protein
VPATLPIHQVIIALKKWSRRARLRHWDRVHSTLAHSIDITKYTHSNPSKHKKKADGPRRGSLLSKNLVIRLPRKAVGTLMRVSVVEEEDNSLSFHTKTYVGLLPRLIICIYTLTCIFVHLLRRLLAFPPL